MRHSDESGQITLPLRRREEKGGALFYPMSTNHRQLHVQLRDNTNRRGGSLAVRRYQNRAAVLEQHAAARPRRVLPLMKADLVSSSRLDAEIPMVLRQGEDPQVGFSPQVLTPSHRAVGVSEGGGARHGTARHGTPSSSSSSSSSYVIQGRSGRKTSSPFLFSFLFFFIFPKAPKSHPGLSLLLYSL